MAGTQTSIDLACDMAEVARLNRSLADFASAQALPENVAKDTRFALEEIVSNVIRHGVTNGAPPMVRVCLFRQGNELTIVVEDDGLAFDPLSRPDPNVDLPLEERPIGGLGIYLVRKIMDDVKYRRDEGKNILTMKKHWK